MDKVTPSLSIAKAERAAVAAEVNRLVEAAQALIDDSDFHGEELPRLRDALKPLLARGFGKGATDA